MELTAIINKINSFLWGVPLLILLLGGGIYLSIKLGFPQIHILKIMKKTVFTLFKKESSESDSLSQFQTFSTALAATVGTGSVVGVGECIRIGAQARYSGCGCLHFSEWGLLTAKTIWE